MNWGEIFSMDYYWIQPKVLRKKILPEEITL